MGSGLMAELLFDSNIVIDALNRNEQARDALKEVDTVVISRISWIEIMAGARGDKAAPTEAYLRGCRIIELDEPIARRAAMVRQSRRIKLPDAIIWATAIVTGRVLVTRDIGDFPADMPGVRHLHQR